MSREAIADRLRLMRDAMGLTQASMARLVGESYQAWNNWELGRDRISLDKAQRLCTATGCSLDWIYRGMMSGLPLDIAEKIQRIVKRETAGEAPKTRGSSRSEKSPSRRPRSRGKL